MIRFAKSFDPATVAVAAALLLTPCVAACQSAPGTPKEAQEQDLGAAERYLAKERAYSPEARAAAQRKLAELKAQAGTLNEDQFRLALAEIVALADNGHSVAILPREQVLPFRLSAIDGEGWLVLRAAPPHQDLAGAVVTAVDGRPFAELMPILTRYFGGTQARREIMVERFFSGGFLHAAGIAKTPGKVDLTFKKPDGTVLKRTVNYVAPAEVPHHGQWSSRWWSPEPIEGDATPWATAVAAGRAPLYLRHANAFFYRAHLRDLGAFYAQMWSNERERDVERFASETMAVLESVRPAIAVIDLRFNKGGDMRTTADLMKRLPELVRDRIYVIVGRYTFSAGITAAALLKKNGGARVRLVGEPMGDRLRFWSEGDHECADNAGVCLRYTDGYFDLVDGCEGEEGCYSDNGRFDMAVGRLDIDLPAPMTTAAYLAGRDPAMEAIAADLKRPN